MAEQHPVQGLMYTAMQSIRDMIDVNTIVGDPVETPDGTVIIPISKVGLGFGVGGTDHSACETPAEKQAPFGGGAGGGVSITPVAFMIVGKGQVRLLPVSSNTSVYDRIIDMVPVAIDKLVEGTESLKKSFSKKKEEKAAEDTVASEISSDDIDATVED